MTIIALAPTSPRPVDERSSRRTRVAGALLALGAVSTTTARRSISGISPPHLSPGQKLAHEAEATRRQIAPLIRFVFTVAVGSGATSNDLGRPMSDHQRSQRFVNSGSVRAP